MPDVYKGWVGIPDPPDTIADIDSWVGAQKALGEGNVMWCPKPDCVGWHSKNYHVRKNIVLAMPIPKANFKIHSDDDSGHMIVPVYTWAQGWICTTCGKPVVVTARHYE